MAYSYDKVHELAKSLKESEEYLEYKQIKEELKKEPELKERVDQFARLRYENQVLTLQGRSQNEENLKRLQELYASLVKNQMVKEYFEKEMRFNLVVADVNKIIGEAIKDVLM